MKNRLTRITTRTGDTGKSGLADGSRHAKTDPVFAAMGDIDELNSVLGLAVAQLVGKASREQLLAVQSTLFDLGASLAVPGRSADMIAEIAELETRTKQLNATLGPLQNFILPGGVPAAAAVHHARTVCRRAERTYWRYLAGQPDAADKSGAVYLNRLSDYLFVLARTVNVDAAHAESIWQPRRRSDSPSE